MMKHISQKFKIFKKYLLNTDIYLIAMTRGNLQPKKKKKLLQISIESELPSINPSPYSIKMLEGFSSI